MKVNSEVATAHLTVNEVRLQHLSQILRHPIRHVMTDLAAPTATHCRLGHSRSARPAVWRQRLEGESLNLDNQIPPAQPALSQVHLRLRSLPLVESPSQILPYVLPAQMCLTLDRNP